MLLNCVGMMYCGDERLTKFAKTYHSNLVSFCNLEWTEPGTNANSSTPSGIETEWKMWYEGECRRRTGYCIWVSVITHFYTQLTRRYIATGLYVGVPFSDAPFAISRRCPASRSLPGSSMGGGLGPRLAPTIRSFHS